MFVYVPYCPNQPTCDVNALNNDRRTPLMMAVLKGYSGCTELLVSYGADLEAEDHEGDTVLHMALFRQTMADIARLQGGEQGSQQSPVLDQVCGVHLKSLASVRMHLYVQWLSLSFLFTLPPAAGLNFFL